MNENKTNPLLISVLIILIVAISIQGYYIHKLDERIESQKTTSVEPVCKSINKPRDDFKRARLNRHDNFDHDISSLFVNFSRRMLDEMSKSIDDTPDFPVNDIDHKMDDSYASFFGEKVDIKKKDNTLVVNMLLPDIDKNSLKATCENNILSVSGSSSSSREDKDSSGKVFRSMQRSGSFSKSFNLPEKVKDSSMKLNYCDDILTLTFEIVK